MKKNQDIRVGIGIDIHPYTRGRALILGGVKIPYGRGLKGHSDADVLVHAIMDSLIGAAGLGDIGIHFPDHDASFRNISSLELLERVQLILKKHKYKIINIDSTLLIEEPKVSPYFSRMKSNVAKALQIKKEEVNIKATRAESLGFVGRKEGCVGYAVCSLRG